MRWVHQLSFLLSFGFTALQRMQPNCPFPLPENISPCTCKTDDGKLVDLACNLNQDMDKDLLRNLMVAFGPRKDIQRFDIDLNGHQWTENFSAEWVGKFRITRLSIQNFESIGGHFQPGAFQSSVAQVIVGSPWNEVKDIKKEQVRIEAGTFANLPNLWQVSLHKSIKQISPGAFNNLPKLKNINLENNNIKKIEDDTFVNVPNLEVLNLSDNKELCHIGNNLKIQNPDLQVILGQTNVKILLEEVFKPFVDSVAKVNGSGIVYLSGVDLNCGCDVKWLNNNPGIHVFKNAFCQDGTPLNQVDFNILENWCPPSNTPGYDSGYGQMYPRVLKSEDAGTLSKVREFKPRRMGNRNDLHENYTISVQFPPIDITFQDFYNGDLKDFNKEETPEYLRLSSKGRSSIEQGHYMGVYSLQGSSVNRFPAWKKQGGNKYLYVATDGYWGFGSDTSTTTVGIYLPQKDPTPKSPINAQGWKYRGHGEFNKDDTIRVDVYTKQKAYLRLIDEDGVTLLSTSDPDSCDGPCPPLTSRHFTSNSSTVLVEFYSPKRECPASDSPSVDCVPKPDRFEIKWQGQGGFIQDRSVFCQCCTP